MTACRDPHSHVRVGSFLDMLGVDVCPGDIDEETDVITSAIVLLVVQDPANPAPRVIRAYSAGSSYLERIGVLDLALAASRAEVIGP